MNQTQTEEDKKFYIKYLEMAIEDLKEFFTTYDGKYKNHPTINNSRELKNYYYELQKYSNDISVPQQLMREIEKKLKLN